MVESWKPFLQKQTKHIHALKSNLEVAQQFYVLGLNCLALAKKTQFKDKSLLKHANKYFFKSIRKNAQFALPYIRIAYILLLVNDFSRALYFLQRALSLEENHPEALELLNYIKAAQKPADSKKSTPQKLPSFTPQQLSFNAQKEPLKAIQKQNQEKNEFLNLIKKIEKVKAKIFTIDKQLKSQLSPGQKRMIEGNKRTLKEELKSTQKRLNRFKAEKRCQNLNAIQESFSLIQKNPELANLHESLIKQVHHLTTIYYDPQIGASKTLLAILEPPFQLLRLLDDPPKGTNLDGDIDHAQEHLTHQEKMYSKEKEAWLKILKHLKRHFKQLTKAEFGPNDVTFNLNFV